MLYVVGTPIGNLEDMTMRGIRILRECTGVIAEDPTHTRKLLNHYEIKVRVIPCNEHATDAKIQQIVSQIEEGGDWAIVSDAGTPGVSDPGGRLVEAALEAGIPVSPIPGVSALTALASIAGIPLPGFTFVGFLPKKKGRQTMLLELAESRWPIVMFESPHRLAKTCAQLAELWGDRWTIVGRELTKLHEEVRRGRLSEMAEYFSKKPPKGEVVLVIDTK